MSMPWEPLLTWEDREVIRKGGYGKKRGLGKKPVLLLLDLQPYFIGLDEPLLQQAKTYPLGGGQETWRRVERLLSLRDAAREAGIPILYTRTLLDEDAAIAPLVGARVEPRLLSGHPDAELLECVHPLPEELVFPKSRDSAFYGTLLDSYLVTLGADTLLIAGASTSGSCRATAVDAITRTYHMAVVEDCLIERFRVSHQTALLDIWMKFGDVMSSDEVKAYLREGKE